MIDLTAYGKRIGYPGPFEPTLSVLTAILNGHTCSIPFENLDVLMGRRIYLDNHSLQNKLVTEKRGGYCFEQNGLLLAVLQEVGFAARPFAGRVRLMTPSRDILPARTHLFVIVELEGEEWLADVGVGQTSLTAPLRLNDAAEQETPHGTRLIEREDGKLYHRALTREGWIDVCETLLEPMPLIDREVASWFTNTHPDSSFKARLVCALARPMGERITLLNRTFMRRNGSETLETRQLENKQELLQVLSSEFGIDLPSDVNLGPSSSDWPTQRPDIRPTPTVD
jgi:N-hydroxyarylamine O-acetyltransferase